MYDVLIKNGKTATGERIEVAIIGEKIAAVSEQFPENVHASKTIDLENKTYVTAGWIDAHVHCYEKMELYADSPDEIGVKNGVTTIVDAGSTGANAIEDFYQITRDVQTNVYALINIAEQGILTQAELADMERIDATKVKWAFEKFPDFVLGIKARMSRTVVGDNDINPLKKAKEIQKENNYCPLMVHIGSTPPTLEKILNELEKGDIVTHCFNGKTNGILDEAGCIKDIAWAAMKKGIIFDVGHGTDSFSFRVAETAFAAGMKSMSISSDIYIRNRINGPVYNLSTVLEKLLEIGYNLDEVIKQVTEVPAGYYHMKNKGKIAVGMDADLTCFTIVEQCKELVDSNGEKRVTNKCIKPSFTIIGGRVYENESE